MKVIAVRALAIPEVKVLRFARYCDARGYFSETFRRSDLAKCPESGLAEVEFVQGNESFSRPGVVRGMHFQWSPYMGKLVRTLFGHMVDLVLDIRRGSPTFGKVIAYDMPVRPDDEYAEWIWVPPGFAHGNFFLDASQIEYLCSGQYSPGCEAAISPLAADLDWSLCDAGLKGRFDEVTSASAILSEKDRNAPNLEAWRRDERSAHFIYGAC